MANFFDLQGHRGARGLYPENTLEGFLLALRLGVVTLEMDIVISRDKKVVLSHDPWFSSDFSALPTGDRVEPERQYDHRIFHLTYEQICAYDCGKTNRRFPRQVAKKAVKPLLEEVIRAADAYADSHGWSPVRYNIEPKTTPVGDALLHPPPEEFVALLVDVIWSEEVHTRSTVQSFDPRVLRIVHERHPELETSLLVARQDFLGLRADLEILGFTPDVYSPDHHVVAKPLIREAHALGMRILPWTVNDANRARWLAKAGVDGLITDFPDTIGSAIGTRQREPLQV